MVVQQTSLFPKIKIVNRPQEQSVIEVYYSYTISINVCIYFEALMEWEAIKIQNF